MRLDIGSGTNPRGDGYVTVDPYQEGAYFRSPMWDLPVEAGSVEAIYCAHALEHVGWQQVGPTLTEWRRVLRPGGELVLRVPDLAWCVCHWFNNRSDPWALAKIFGSQEHEGNAHRSGYDRDGWARHLADAGFTIAAEHVLWTHEQQTLEFVCVSP